MQLESNGKPMNPGFYVIKCLYTYEYYNVIIIQLRVTDTGTTLDDLTPTWHIVLAISFIYMEQILMLML